MTTVEVKLDLPNTLAKATKDAGLLAPEALERIIAEALRRQNFDELLSVADRAEAAGIPPMSAEELNAEIHAYRGGAPPRRGVESDREPTRSSR